MADDCLACALAAGQKPLPGGLLHRTENWLVDHCVGPLGLGTLIVKPERHVTAVADLSPAEAAELGPLLQLASWVAGQLVGADQVYNCLWSHAGGVPGHIHYDQLSLQSSQWDPPRDTVQTLGRSAGCRRGRRRASPGPFRGIRASPGLAARRHSIPGPLPTTACSPPRRPL